MDTIYPSADSGEGSSTKNKPLRNQSASGAFGSGDSSGGQGTPIYPDSPYRQPESQPGGGGYPMFQSLIVLLLAVVSIYGAITLMNMQSGFNDMTEKMLRVEERVARLTSGMQDYENTVIAMELRRTLVTLDEVIQKAKDPIRSDALAAKYEVVNLINKIQPKNAQHQAEGQAQDQPALPADGSQEPTASALPADTITAVTAEPAAAPATATATPETPATTAANGSAVQQPAAALEFAAPDKKDQTPAAATKQ